LPWSEQPPSPETECIRDELVRLNRLGYLTINSQPAVNGAKSSDRVFGWGPKGGYVYQKAYLEFFVAADRLDDLLERISKDPAVTFYAVNREVSFQLKHSDCSHDVTLKCTKY
jgi:methylenetetrahydrofolate reductase (NADPH)